jgi:hypothetical protein
VLDDTNNKGYCGSNKKDLEDPVFEVFEDQFKE